MRRPHVVYIFLFTWLVVVALSILQCALRINRLVHGQASLALGTILWQLLLLQAAALLACQTYKRRRRGLSAMLHRGKYLVVRLILSRSITRRADQHVNQLCNRITLTKVSWVAPTQTPPGRPTPPRSPPPPARPHSLRSSCTLQSCPSLEKPGRWGPGLGSSAAGA